MIFTPIMYGVHYVFHFADKGRKVTTCDGNDLLYVVSKSLGDVGAGSGTSKGDKKGIYISPSSRVWVIASLHLVYI